jgi:hypothetical protein
MALSTRVLVRHMSNSVSTGKFLNVVLKYVVRRTRPIPDLNHIYRARCSQCAARVRPCMVLVHGADVRPARASHRIFASACSRDPHSMVLWCGIDTVRVQSNMEHVIVIECIIQTHNFTCYGYM